VELDIRLTEDSINSQINVDLASFTKVNIDRSNVGLKEQRYHNLYGLARQNTIVKNFVTTLANNGLYLTGSKGGVSTFHKFISASSFSKHVKRDGILHHKSILYTLEEPIYRSSKNRLIVVFSSAAGLTYNADIATRNFFVNFKSIQKYIPTNTYVLRIADIGGVVGSFYLNNNFNGEVENDTQSLISTIAEKLNIHHNDIVLFGPSKGGVGSLYHALLGGFKCVSVDPVVTGEYYFKNHDDKHFVGGIFPMEREDSFLALLEKAKLTKNINIICSEQSPIYGEILQIFGGYLSSINIFNVMHPKIRGHADLGVNAMNILTLLINNLFYEIATASSKRIEN
jgi:hypothetical protein